MVSGGCEVPRALRYKCMQVLGLQGLVGGCLLNVLLREAGRTNEDSSKPQPAPFYSMLCMFRCCGSAHTCSRAYLYILVDMHTHMLIRKLHKSVCIYYTA